MRFNYSQPILLAQPHDFNTVELRGVNNYDHSDDTDDASFTQLFRISYQYYSAIGALTCFLARTFASAKYISINVNNIHCK
jgi:hypothetical protein